MPIWQSCWRQWFLSILVCGLTTGLMAFGHFDQFNKVFDGYIEALFEAEIWVVKPLSFKLCVTSLTTQVTSVICFFQPDS